MQNSFPGAFHCFNYGTIEGGGGSGGSGTLEVGCSGLSYFALYGQLGGSAIATNSNVQIKINNIGIVGGTAGKAISGGSGNVINNAGSGQVFGVVD